MKIHLQTAPRGIALVMVMLVLFMLGVLAGGFAYSMKVELRLAQNHNYETEMEWMGRSGVELARYVLGQELTTAGGYTALNQKWAGGTADTNQILADISLENNTLGIGKFSVKIIDAERKFNINVADQAVLQQAFNLVGIDAADSSALIDSILDWMDPDDNTRVQGTESDYYLTQDPPYFAKNGPIDDISELLLVRGITPRMYWGPGPGDTSVSAGQVAANRIFGQAHQSQGTAGLVDLFTAVSGSRGINVNTASATVLQLIPGIDDNMAQAIVQMRAGPDGVPGNEDDIPFRSPGDVVNVPGIGRQLAPQFMRYMLTQSLYFEVHVYAQIENYRREYVALIRRNNPRDLPTLYFCWK